MMTPNNNQDANQDPEELAESPQEESYEQSSAIPIPDDLFPDAQEGDTVSGQAEFTLETKDDGSRCLVPTKIEGKPVGAPPPPVQNDQLPDAPPAPAGSVDDAASALKKALVQTNRGGRMPA